jgi:DNA-binding CsgD family transcriptional regulator
MKTTGLGSAISTWISSLPAREAQPTPQPTATKVAVLTPRELDVLRLLGGGCTYAQAAARLGVSPHTVVTHLKNAYRKLDVHSAAAAVMRVMELGLFQKAREDACR